MVQEAIQLSFPIQSAASERAANRHLEIRGDELVATWEGKSVTVQSPLIAVDKHSVMLVAGTEASFRHLRVWEGLPNPDWEKNKEGW